MSNLSADLVPVCTNDVQSHQTDESMKCDESPQLHTILAEALAVSRFSSDGIQINADEVEKYNKLARMKINC